MNCAPPGRMPAKTSEPSPPLADGSRLPSASGGDGSLVLAGILPGGAQFIPDIVGMGCPLGVGQARDLQFFFLQSPMAIRTDGLDARPPQLQHVAPGAGLDRHAQPREAHPAPPSLV